MANSTRTSDVPASTPQKATDGRPRAAAGGSDKRLLHFSGYIHPYREDVTLRDVAWGLGAAVTWVVFFAAGVLLPAKLAMSTFWTGRLPSILDALKYGPVVIAAYGVTNILFLACSASILGCVAQRWQVSDELQRIPDDAAIAPATRAYFAAFLRGFFLYLLFLGGFILVSTKETLAEVQFDQYVRLAGLVSMFGFVLGYDPNLVARLIQRVIEVMPTSEAPAAANRKAAASSREEQDAAVEGLDHPLSETEELARAKEEDLNK